MPERIAVETSFAQQALWLEHQLDPAEPTYHVMALVRVRGTLDEQALERALGTVIQRHETLRTVFDFVDGRPMQLISADYVVPVRVVETTAEQIDELIRAEVRTPFDLRQGPLLRLTLLRLRPDHHVVVLALHHIVTDGMSSEILFGELSAAYQATIEGRVLELPELPIQYADFAVWQRQTLSGATLQRLTRFWADRLSGWSLPRLPADRTGTGPGTSLGRSVWFTIPGATISALEAVARTRQATLFMALLAAFDVLLARYSSQHDITVLSPVAGRERPELDGLIGYFVNLLPLRVDLEGDPSFLELVDRVRETCVTAWDHQQLPYELIVGAQRVRRAQPGRASGAEVMLALQNTRPLSWRIPGLEFEPLWVETGTAKVDLLLDIRPGEQEYRARLEYRSELFDDATARQVADQLTILLRRILADPTAPVSTLRLSDAEERELPLSMGRDLPAEPSAKSPDLRFTRRAGLSPEVPGPDVAGNAMDDDNGPRTPFEEAMARIWCEALGLGEIGRHDDFFELGGQSLTAVRITAVIREEFGVELGIRDLYENFTVADMAWKVLGTMTDVDD